jgi:hypothetical protein
MDEQEFRTLESTLAEEDGTVWSGAPDLASSTDAMENTSGKRITLYVSGGTVTVIAVNGVTTGLTSGNITLRPGDSVAITYSEAPTLAWLFGE